MTDSIIDGEQPVIFGQPAWAGDDSDGAEGSVFALQCQHGGSSAALVITVDGFDGEHFEAGLELTPGDVDALIAALQALPRATDIED